MSSQNKVTVRVEVVVEGSGHASMVSAEPLPPVRGIIAPTRSPANTTVYPSGSQYCIAASGQGKPMGDIYPTVVKAMAYPRPDATPQQSGLGTPPDTAPTATLGDGGYWSFSQAKKNLVPGAHAPDGVSGGRDNSSFIVWYDYGTGTYPQNDFTPFHTYQTSSGGGSGGGILAAAPGPALLYATFTGALAKWGKVTLTWNGVSWVGAASGGEAIVSLRCHDGFFELMSVGPSTAFIVAGQPNVHPHFHWTAEETALGTLSGPFRVTITE